MSKKLDIYRCKKPLVLRYRFRKELQHHVSCLHTTTWKLDLNLRIIELDRAVLKFDGISLQLDGLILVWITYQQSRLGGEETYPYLVAQDTTTLSSRCKCTPV